MRLHRAADSGPPRGGGSAQWPSDGQARAALGAAGRQDLAASDRLHPGAKAVRARAAQLRRLISAFHRGTYAGGCLRDSGGAGKRLAAGSKSLTLERVTAQLSMTRSHAGRACAQRKWSLSRRSASRRRRCRAPGTAVDNSKRRGYNAPPASRTVVASPQPFHHSWPLPSCIPFRNPRRGPPACKPSSRSSRPSNSRPGSVLWHARTSRDDCG